MPKSKANILYNSNQKRIFVERYAFLFSNSYPLIMLIRSAVFVKSSPKVESCPKTDLPEYAFIGRSNVGKSSLINMLTDISKLAKVSGKPGKTQLINHFMINDNWHLVDLPGYGYAKVSKQQRDVFWKMITNYILKRENLHCVFVLIDSRHEPQKNDVEFINWLGTHGVPQALIFTKSDKLTERALASSIERYKKHLQEFWEDLPPFFISSSTTQRGREEILEYIDSINHMLSNNDQ